MAVNGKESLDEYAGHNGDLNPHLEHIRTAQSINMSPELFEKLYISPQHYVKGDLRKKFANPTPIALVGFILALTPLSCDLMGWRGAGGTGAAGVGTYYFFGGMLQLIGGVLEFFLGNTFPCVVFLSFSAFFLSFGATLTPTFAASASYAPAGEDASTGAATQGFNASFGFFTLWMAVLCVLFLICAFRTNVCFVFIFFTLTLAFVCLTAAYWLLASDYVAHATSAGKLIQAAGGALFACSLAGWYINFAIMLAVMDFPFGLPVGDLSNVVKSATDRKKKISAA